MLKPSQNLLSSKDKLIRWGALGILCAPLTSAYIYSLDYKVSLIGCPIRQLIGIPCPTCGMTRSFIATARGNLSQAFTEHLFGPVLFASMLLAAVHISFELKHRRQIQAIYWDLLKLRQVQLVGMLAYFCYYIFRIYSLWNW